MKGESLCLPQSALVNFSLAVEGEADDAVGGIFFAVVAGLVLQPYIFLEAPL